MLPLFETILQLHLFTLFVNTHLVSVGFTQAFALRFHSQYLISLYFYYGLYLSASEYLYVIV